MTRNKKYRCSNLSYQALESRLLLAGNVHVYVESSILVVVGDGAANILGLSINNAGNVVATGNATTVNGSTGPFEVTSPFENVSLFMSGGNDVVTVDGITARQNFSFYGEDGNDQLTVTNTSVRHFHTEGGAGDDVYELDMNVQKSAYMYLGDGNDVVAMPTMNVGRNFKIFGGNGNDTITSQTLRVNRKLSFNMDDGNDSVLIAGETVVRKNATIKLGAGNDFAAILPATNNATATFRSYAEIHGESGNDNVAVDANIVLKSKSRLDGGGGTNSISAGVQDLGRSKVVNFQNSQISNLTALRDAVFARLREVNIDATPYGGTIADQATLTVSPAALSYTEDAAATSVDAGLLIGSTGTPTITGATVKIDGFQAGQDLLAFANSNLISGAFSATNGTMTLTGSATTAEYQQALRSVQYSNTSQTPTNGARELQFTVTTATQSLTGARALTVVPVNDGPTVLLQSALRTFNVGALPLLIDNQLQVADTDNAQLTQATVAFTNGYITGEDSLTFAAQAGITGLFDAVTGALTLTGAANVAAYQTVLRSVAFANSDSTPTFGSRTVRFTVNDGTTTGFDNIDLELVQNNGS